MFAGWNRRLAAAIAAAALACSPAVAQVLYKWTGADGKVNYSDAPPKNFKGEVQRIEPPEPASASPAPAAAPAPRAAAPAPAREVAAEPRPPGIAAQRRATRAQLELQLARARADVDAARKALEEAVPEPDERQTIQQRKAQGGMHGMTPRLNCRVERTAAGKATMCPTSVPTPEYYDRVTRLEEAVKKAEEELAAAEEAWRRGVD